MFKAQSEEMMPLALVRGEPMTELPRDLYIPPDALEVILETFEGPLDLLLYLIRRQNLDILDIHIAEVTRQYMKYVDIMKELRLELAAEYLVMAAMLAEIKSRMLLPRVHAAETEETDPRAELIRRLQEYEQLKEAAASLDTLPRQGRDTFQISAERPDFTVAKPLPKLELKELLLAFTEVMQRIEMSASHRVQRESLSIRERMSQILARMSQENFVEFKQLFSVEEGRMGVVVTFIALLELIKQSLIELVQAEPFSPIHIKAVAA